MDLYGLGWAIVLISTFIIDHFDLFGLKQTIFYARGKPYPRPQFEERLFYRHVRHPLMLGQLRQELPESRFEVCGLPRRRCSARSDGPMPNLAAR